MSNTEQIAHVRALEDGSYEAQPLLDHLHGVAELAQSYAERITDYPELGEIGYLLGLLHDLGKYQEGSRSSRSASGLTTEVSTMTPSGEGKLSVLVILREQ